MALSLKEKKIANDFREKLESLSCPYIEGVEDSWVIELIYRPGEPRIRLLQWLFSKFDSSLNDLLDPQYASSDSKMDSRIQRLLFVASALGLCCAEDAELIRGSCSVSKQTSFMEQLLEMVCIMDSSQDPHFKSMNSPGHISGGLSVEEQFSHDCYLMDNLADEHRVDALFTTNTKLLPPDILKHLDAQHLDAQHPDGGRPLPDLTELASEAEKLTLDMEKQQDRLMQLRESHVYSPCEPSASHRVHATLRLTLTELHQLLTGFSSCFETELRPWCNKDPPALNQLGPAFKRVHTMLETFTQLLTSLGDIRSSYTDLCGTLRERLTKIVQQDTKLSKAGNEANMTVADMKSFRQCVDVLEESIVRLDNSLNTSMRSGLTISTITPGTDY